MEKVKHPAKYSDELMPILQKKLEGRERVLDPFAGTGKLKEIVPNAFLLEIEPEWAAMSGAICGDATQMPFTDSFFDAICTSPTYGNRMADHFKEKEPGKYVRNTYTHALGRPLNTNNSGRMNWGNQYRDLHKKAYKEFLRVLKHDGIVVLNVSDHIRNKELVPVVLWHQYALAEMGFVMIEKLPVKTRRQGFGANRERADCEFIMVFEKSKSEA